jgi:hypothetical protein
MRRPGAAARTRAPARARTSDCPDLCALPASRRAIVGKDRFGALTACDTRRAAYGAERRAILTHSPELHAARAAGFTGTTLAKAGQKPDDLAATLARGRTRRPRENVQAEIEQVTAKPWVRRVIRWELTGDQPRNLRLSWSIEPVARQELEEEIFGKHVLITSHDHWPVPEIIAGYRSQSEAGFSFRQLKDPHAVSFSPHVPLDRARHPRPRLHLRPRLADRAPDAPQGPPGRAGPVRPPATVPARRHRRDTRAWHLLAAAQVSDPAAPGGSTATAAHPQTGRVTQARASSLTRHEQADGRARSSD